MLRLWHGVLRLAKQPVASWHRDRVREELKERRTAKTWGHRLSETSDVLFSLSRARYDGFPIRSLPRKSVPYNSLAYTYMVAKYTSRWGFYRVAAYLSGAPRPDLVREVVNPTKSAKLDEVARRHQIDPTKFKTVSRQLLRIWPIFP
ncbi:hypothetical protein BJY00DRAFT_166367 [Aspergillus carlsbadensis]|nr:hypothetical protein BJY00DRAFT_166367 [Aspergillus carlsbadensis]